MNRTLLEERLAALDASERERLARRASRLRDEARRRARVARGGERKGSGRHGDELPAWALRLRDASLDDWTLRLLEEDLLNDPTPQAEGPVEGRAGVVLWVGRKLARVELGGEELEVTLAGDLQRASRSSLAVGDTALVQGEGDAARLVRVLPRRTLLSRPDPHDAHMERLIAANVDLVVIVVSVRSPPLREGLIDRYLVVADRGGADALVLVNKADLLGEDREALEAILRPYADIGLRVLYTSAREGAGIEALRAAIAGRTTVFVGHSGVGKSSILNALAPDLALRTGEVNAWHGKGRHTTTASELHDLGDGTRIIDTPGVRSLGLTRVDAGALGWFFPEFEPFVGDCAYRDCTHDHEPDCAVRRAVEAGALPRRRFDSYLRLLRSLAEED